MELPVVQPAPAPRADAARNRERILEAAQRLFAQRGVAGPSMECIAAAAGVGKGTLFRRFGDRASLVFAVLDETERAFQEAFLSGPPPLGPGAPATERLIAFGEAMVDFVEAHGELLVQIESGDAGQWRRSAPYGAHWIHVRGLIEESRPDADAGYLADVLLGALSPQTVRHQRRQRGLPPSAVKAAYAELVTRITRGEP